MLDLNDLSDREQAVLELASEGLTDREIGDRLGISAATVSSYWVRIRGKLGHFTRTEFAAKYLRSKSDQQFSDLMVSHQLLESQAAQNQSSEKDVRMARFYKSALIAIPDALIVLDGECCIEFANDRACEFLGFGQADLVGEPIQRIFPQNVAANQLLQFQQAIAAKGIRQLGRKSTLFVSRPRGTHTRVIVHMNGFTTPAGHSTVCIIRSFMEEVEAMRDQVDVIRQTFM